MKKPFFIDKNINILTGDKAIEALSKENDGEFLSKDKGVVRVSTERWEKAQECEKNHWMIRGIKSGNDRNDYHFEQFNKYEDIRNKTFDSMVECIREASNKSVEWCKNASELTIKNYKENFSVEGFRKNFNNLIFEILKEK